VPGRNLVGMRRWAAVLAAPLAAITLLPVLAPAAGSELPRLVATVGPDTTIDLADADGKHVDSLVAATYELLVRDRSPEHNFVLANKNGFGFRVDSGVEFVGEKTFTIDLRAGRYGYACSPHWQTMNGSLLVVPEPVPTPARRALTVTLGAGGALALSAKSVPAGDYRIGVRDRSKTRNVHLVGPGVNRSTGKAFVGTVSWDVTLRRGTYRFGSDPLLTGRLVVT
jgi:hypothetical protein